jgi:hypothetical protein
MEKIMSKTNDTSRLATHEDHDTLADSELDAVTGAWNAVGMVTGAVTGAVTGGGGKGNGSGSWLEALAIAMGHAMN